MTTYLEWVKQTKQKLSNSKSILLDHRKYKAGKTVLDPKKYTSVPRSKVPDDVQSIVMLMPYNEDTDYDKSSFIQLQTCSKSCCNKGIFEKDEIETYAKSSDKCMMCQEAFAYSSKQLNPPIYGSVLLSIEQAKIATKVYDFYKIGFYIDGGKSSDNIPFPSERKIAYIPIVNYKDKKEYHDKSILAVWLYLQAWKNNRLFNLGQSLSLKTFGVTYGTIHMKSSLNPFDAHGYGNAPIKYFKKTALLNLLSECSAHGIYTPKMEDAFLLENA